MLIENLKTVLIPALGQIGYELVDIEFAKKYGQDNLTIYIDCPLGITFEDCEKAHAEVDKIMDELDPLEGAYVLNVSSPGLDRHFKTQRDFERNYNREVEIKLNAPIKGKKYLEGVLVARDENCVIIKQGGLEVKTENTKINFVRPLVKFE